MRWSRFSLASAFVMHDWVANNRSAVLRALSHRDFRLFFAGQFVSLIGTWMQGIAQSWLVYRLTGSSVLLGLVAFLLACGLWPVPLLKGNLSAASALLQERQTVSVPAKTMSTLALKTNP